MATIIENRKGRRIIRVSTDDIISLVREYQICACSCSTYSEIRRKLNNKDIYIPEDVWNKKIQETKLSPAFF